MDLDTKTHKTCRCCKECKTRYNEEFSKLLNLKCSGLIVYVHNDGKAETETDGKQSIILQNVRNEPIKKSDLCDELCRYRTKCYKCNSLIQGVCNIVKKIRNIRENEIIAVCKYCKRANVASKCKSCDYLIQMFNKKMKSYEDPQQALDIRLYEVRRILSLIVDKKGLCNHKACQLYYDTDSELKLLLELLKTTLPKRQPAIEEYNFLTGSCIPPVSGNSDEDLFMLYRQQLENLSNESLQSTTSDPEGFCICKYLQNRDLDLNQSVAPLLTEPEQVSKSISMNQMLIQEKGISIAKDITEKFSYNKIPRASKELSKLKRFPKKPQLEEEIKSSSYNEKNVPLKEKKSVNNETAKEKKSNKNAEHKNIRSKQDTDEQMMMKMIKAREQEKKEINKNFKAEKISTMAKIEDLPEIKSITKEIEIESEISESVVECSQEQFAPEIIQGTKLFPFHPQIRQPCTSYEPLIFKVKHDCVLGEHILKESITPDRQTSTTFDSLNPVYHGYLRYELSNRTFIDKGWTKLPSVNVMRWVGVDRCKNYYSLTTCAISRLGCYDARQRTGKNKSMSCTDSHSIYLYKMNVYKMVPAYPQFDWFANHKKKKSISYSTGQKLAEIDDNGSGRWFYENGSVALEYTKDLNSKRKYAVYSITDEVKGTKQAPRKALALFDHLGNGIVYDDTGNVRLKYNQSEGAVIDKKIGPPSKWKWHSLNDPPVLKHVYIDTWEETSPCFKKYIRQDIDDSDLRKSPDNEDMLAIELQNFMKERAHKVLQNYRPFEIKPKNIKINEYFSMRITSQANIHLTFRSSQNCLKVNVGMWLRNNEIIDIMTSEIADVNTPFDSPILDF